MCISSNGEGFILALELHGNPTDASVAGNRKGAAISFPVEVLEPRCT